MSEEVRKTIGKKRISLMHLLDDSFTDCFGSGPVPQDVLDEIPRLMATELTLVEHIEKHDASKVGSIHTERVTGTLERPNEVGQSDNQQAEASHVSHIYPSG